MKVTAKIDWLEAKKPDWKVASLTTGDGTKYTEVSINKVGKKGDVFPGFDGLMAGVTVEGELWVSQAGKNYLFPPKDPLQNPPRRGAGAIGQAMQQKERSIEKFQNAKEDSIRIAGANRDATLLLTTFYPEYANAGGDKDRLIQQKWIEIRDWELKKWEPVELADDHGGRWEGAAVDQEQPF